MENTSLAVTITTPSFTLAAYTGGSESADTLALVLPGRLDTKDYAHMHGLVDFLASHGHFALSFDPPDTWESGGGIESYSTSNYIKAVHELIELYGKPTLLAGHSRGDSIAVLAGANHPSVTGIVAIMANCGSPAPPKETTKQTGFQVESRDLPPSTSHTDKQKLFDLPLHYFEDGQQYNPATLLKSCTKPKLLLAGTEDTICNPERVRQLYQDIPEPKQLHMLQSGHDYRYDPKTIAEIHRIIGDFLNTENL